MKKIKTAYVPKAHKVSLMERICSRLADVTGFDACVFQDGKFHLITIDLDVDEYGSAFYCGQYEETCPFFTGLKEIIKSYRRK